MAVTWRDGSDGAGDKQRINNTQHGSRTMAITRDMLPKREAGLTLLQQMATSRRQAGEGSCVGSCHANESARSRRRLTLGKSSVLFSKRRKLNRKNSEEGGQKEAACRL